MCGIAGVFNHPSAFQQVQAALALLRNRGRDAAGISNFHEVQHHHDISKFYPLPGKCIVGHALHAVVDEVPQPLKGKGVLVANCEIYNWEKLNVKYSFKAKNDAELLLSLLDKFGIDKIEELDGVYAFAYWNKEDLYLVRDILGEKPLWFVHTSDGFAFASEKKVLEKLGYLDIQELNPRLILHYYIHGNRYDIISRSFFEYLPEHKDSYEKLKQKTAVLLDAACQKRIPARKFGLLFSGGVDSTYLANYFKQHGYEFTCYTAVLAPAGAGGSSMERALPADLLAAQKAAKELGLNLKIKKIALEQIPAYLQKIVPLIEDSNVVKVGVALPFYIACEMAREDGCKVIFSGLGSEELFAGYERHKQSGNVNRECVSGLLKIYERDLYRDDVITMDNALELRLPYLDVELVKYALKIPGKYKLKDAKDTKDKNDAIGKYILREIAAAQGIPDEFAFRKKTAAQYGSKFDYALEKLARRNKFPTKSAYLRTFYPAHNLRLGVLYSGGKDSTYAAYIMQKQNYELACLITMKSTNKESFMFQSAGVEMTELQAKAMELPLVVGETKGEKEKELSDLEKTIRVAKEKYKLDGIVSGALFSTYQRDRIEKICDKLGLKIFAPLWHKAQEEEMRELLQRGFVFVLSAVAAEGLAKSWLNKVITEKDIEKLKELQRKVGINLSGEGGETESIVLDCPLFKKKLFIVKSRVVEEGKYAAYLVVEEAELKEK